MNTEVDVINIKITSDGTGAIKDIDKLTASLTKFADAAEKVNSTGDLSALERVAKATSDFARSVKSIRTLNSALNSITKTCEQFDTSGAIIGIELLGEAIRDNFSEADLQRIRDFADAFRQTRAIRGGSAAIPAATAPAGGLATAPVDTSAVESATEKVSFLHRVVEGLPAAFSKVRSFASKTFGAIKTGAGVAATVIKKTAGAPFVALGKAFGGVMAKAQGFFQMFKKRLLYRLINSIIFEVTNGIKEGISNLYQWSSAFGGTFSKSMDRAATSLLYFKNSLGAMIAPLINMLVPILERVIQRIVGFVNTLNQLFAKLSGASTWTKALMYPIKYAENTNKATKAAKKWKATILGIDELNLMADNSQNDNGNSGKDNLDYSKMFETVALPDNSILGHFFDPFLEAWKTKGQWVIDNWKYALQSVKTLLRSIGKSFAEVWQNGTGQRSLEYILGILGNCLLYVGNLATALNTAWTATDELGNVLGTKLIQAIWDDINAVLSFFDQITLAHAEFVGTLDFTPMLTSLISVFEQLEPLINTLGDGLMWIMTDIIEPVEKWAIESVLPTLLDILAEAISAIEAALRPVIDGVKDVWDALKPAFAWIGDVAIKILEGLKTIIAKVGDVFREKGDKIREACKGIGDIVKVVWGWVEPIVKAAGTVITVTFDLIGDVIRDTIGFIIDLLHGIIEFIAGIFTGDWQRAWDAVGNIFGGIYDFILKIGGDLLAFFGGLLGSLWEILVGAMQGIDSFLRTAIDGLIQFVVNAGAGIKRACANIINGILAGVESFVNGIVRGINWVIDCLNKLSFDVPDWIPVVGGKHFGFSINHIQEIHLPRLAEGGMVNAGTMFVAGEAGAEIVADIGNRTGVMNIDQMQDAVRDGITEGSEPQNALLRQILYLVSSINDKDFNPEITTGDIRRSLSRANRRDGRTVIPVSP